MYENTYLYFKFCRGNMKSQNKINYGSHYNEKEILSEIKDGNTTSFSDLSTYYHKRIAAAANSFSLPASYFDDLMQEGYIALYNAACAFESEYSSFKTFSGICIRNRMINWIEKNVNPLYKFLPLSQVDETVISKSSMISQSFEERVIMRNQLDDLKQQAERILSPLENKIFNLYLLGYNADEVCKELSITKKNCENALFRLRKKLKPLIYET